MELKRIHTDAIPRALELAERYRLLNEPEQAVSICRDILEADANHQVALRTLLLALTDDFSHPGAAGYQDAEQTAARLNNPYEQAYYRGVVYERWGRARLKAGDPPYLAGEWLKKAMEQYDEAQRHMPPQDDSAVLRWNSCARLAKRVPALFEESAVHELHMGD